MKDVLLSEEMWVNNKVNNHYYNEPRGVQAYYKFLRNLQSTVPISSIVADLQEHIENAELKDNYDIMGYIKNRILMLVRWRMTEDNSLQFEDTFDKNELKRLLIKLSPKLSAIKDDHYMENLALMNIMALLEAEGHEEFRDSKNILLNMLKSITIPKSRYDYVCFLQCWVNSTETKISLPTLLVSLIEKLNWEGAMKPILEEIQKKNDKSFFFLILKELSHRQTLHSVYHELALSSAISMVPFNLENANLPYAAYDYQWKIIFTALKNNINVPLIIEALKEACKHENESSVFKYFMDCGDRTNFGNLNSHCLGQLKEVIDIRLKYVEVCIATVHESWKYPTNPPVPASYRHKKNDAQRFIHEDVRSFFESELREMTFSSQPRYFETFDQAQVYASWLEERIVGIKATVLDSPSLHLQITKVEKYADQRFQINELLLKKQQIETLHYAVASRIANNA